MARISGETRQFSRAVHRMVRGFSGRGLARFARSRPARMLDRNDLEVLRKALAHLTEENVADALRVMDQEDLEVMLWIARMQRFDAQLVNLLSYERAMSEAQRRGVMGGGIYDSLPATFARHKGAKGIVTRNPSRFAHVAPDLEILTPQPCVPHTMPANAFLKQLEQPADVEIAATGTDHVHDARTAVDRGGCDPYLGHAAGKDCHVHGREGRGIHRGV